MDAASAAIARHRGGDAVRCVGALGLDAGRTHPARHAVDPEGCRPDGCATTLACARVAAGGNGACRRGAPAEGRRRPVVRRDRRARHLRGAGPWSDHRQRLHHRESPASITAQLVCPAARCGTVDPFAIDPQRRGGGAWSMVDRPRMSRRHHARDMDGLRHGGAARGRERRQRSARLWIDDRGFELVNGSAADGHEARRLMALDRLRHRAGARGVGSSGHRHGRRRARRTRTVDAAITRHAFDRASHAGGGRMRRRAVDRAVEPRAARPAAHAQSIFCIARR